MWESITITGIISAAVAAVLIVLISQIGACSERQAQLKGDCIRNGGSAITAGDTFHCIGAQHRPESN